MSSVLIMSNDQNQQAAASMPGTHLQALNLLCAMGWHYLPPAVCLAKRGGRRQVLLQSSLMEVLQTRRYTYNGQSHLLTPNGIEQIVRELSSIPQQQGLANMNAALYEKLRLGITVTEFLPDGKKHQPTIPVIDWQNRKANRFEVCELFEVLASHGKHARSAGLVCFVNGIPLAVIEAPPCEGEESEAHLLARGMERHVQHQQADEIPLLYAYAQLLFALGRQDGCYGTTLSEAGNWAHWREEQLSEDVLQKMQNTPLSVEARSALQTEQALPLRNQLKRLWSEPGKPNDMTRLLMGLLSPARILEFLGAYVLFNAKAGKMVARSQQFFAVRNIIDRISQRTERGARLGGILWHSAGAGKATTMVFLSKALLQHESLKECRIVIVSEQAELEMQLAHNFINNGAYGSVLQTRKEGERAKVRSGHDLARRISSGNERIIFTLMQRFQAASSLDLCYNPSHQMIVLVDEGHHSKNAELHLRMRKALPRAAFVAFSGTPLLRRDKEHNSFGPVLHTYSQRSALIDQLLLPVLYEERPLAQTGPETWFTHSVHALNAARQQKLQLEWQEWQQELAPEHLPAAMLAWDVALHFSENIKPLGLGLKGQLICSSRGQALLCHRFLQRSHLLHSALLLQAPEVAEGEEDDASLQPLLQEWCAAWPKDGAQAEQQERELLQAMRNGAGPDIVISVDKYLPDLDMPGLGVLYLQRKLATGLLLQTLARINRHHSGKRHALVIDYGNQLAQLDTSVHHFQNQTCLGYDKADLEGVVRQIASEYLRLPLLLQQLLSLFDLPEESPNEHLHAQLLEHLRQTLLPQLSSTVEGHDLQQERRNAFFHVLAEFAHCLQLALSARQFFADPVFAATQLARYRHCLSFFASLQQMACNDAQEIPLDPLLRHTLPHLLQKLGASPADPLAEAQEPQHWSAEKAQNEAGLIRVRLHKTLAQELEDDPYARQVFSRLLQEACASADSQAADPHAQYRILHALELQIAERDLEQLPEVFKRRPQAAAFYGLFRMVLGEAHFAATNAAQHSAYVEQALAMEDVVMPAIRENTLNPENIETQIRSKLLPRLFLMLGMEQARQVMEMTVKIAAIRSRRLRRRA